MGIRRKPITAVVGDIHGCAETLDALLDTLALQRGDTLVTVGDYIDRGPNSRRVVSLLLGCKRRGVKLIPLIGNHEAMLIAALSLSKKWEERFTIYFPKSFWEAGVYPGNGILPTVDSYGWDWRLFREPGFQNCGLERYAELATEMYVTERNFRRAIAENADRAEMPKSHVKFFQNLRFYYHDPTLNVFVVHAELPKRLLRRSKIEYALGALTSSDYYDSILWGRSCFNVTPRFNTRIIHGHTPLPNNPVYVDDDKNPRLIKGKIDLDTGSSYGYPLSALILPTWEVVKQRNLDM